MADRAQASRKTTPKVVSVIGFIFAGCFGLVWTLGWTAGTLFFDAMVAKGLYDSWRSTSFKPVEGRVVSSDVKVEHDSEGDSRRAQIKYMYWYGGREFQAERLTYGMHSSADSWVDRYPANKSIQVYLDPANPSDAVLLPGLSMSDFFVPLFLMPFNIVMVGAWYMLLHLARRALTPHAVVRPRVIHDGAITRYRLPEHKPLHSIAFAAIAISFGLVFAVGFPLLIFQIKWIVPAGWLVFFGGVALVAWRTLTPLWRGDRDLAIDELRGRVSLPQTFGRTQPQELKRSSLYAVETEVVIGKDSDGDDTTERYTVLRFADDAGKLQAARIIKWDTEEMADQFSTWLRDELKIKPMTIEAEPA